MGQSNHNWNIDDCTFQKDRCDVPQYNLSGPDHADWNFTAGAFFQNAFGGRMYFGGGRTTGGTAQRTFPVISGTPYELQLTMGRASGVVDANQKAEIRVYDEDGTILASEDIDDTINAGTKSYTFTPAGDTFSVIITDVTVAPAGNSSDWSCTAVLLGLDRGSMTKFHEIYDIESGAPELLHQVDKDGELYTPVNTVIDCPDLIDLDVLAQPTVTAPPSEPAAVPDQEVCTGDFTDTSARTGWLHPWTPFITANTGTVNEDWIQVSTAETSPECVTDITVNLDMGNSYIMAQNVWVRLFYGARLLIDGVQVSAYALQKYHYEDDTGNANLGDYMTPLGSVHFARSNVPAGAVITVEMQRSYNMVMGPAAVGITRGRVIGGLRAHFNVHYSPINIVTGRV